MEIRQWVGAELTDARQRLKGGVLDLIPADRRAEQADGGGIPAVYVLWHLTRHHDVAINGVLRGVDEVVHAHSDALGVSTGLWRGLSEGSDLDLIDQLDREAVGQYALAAIDSTLAWIDNGASFDDLDAVPDSGAVLEALGAPSDDFSWLYGMWAGKTRQWFLSWEGIGHVVTHTGELVTIRNRLGLSPF
ncbi:MAG: hypothetical protein GY929_03970 [Actinomycetia bacterium]|nr:hypothetical protein [Actinomycetes bacterium]